MNKYENNKLVETMDAIVLLNNKYEHIGLKEGYIGTVVDYVKNLNVVLADFFNPFTGEDIYVQAEIKIDDFRVIGASTKDQKLVNAYKDLFR